MKRAITVVKNIAATVGALATIGGVIWLAFQANERMHTDPQHVEEAEEFFKDYDEVKAYGEYIIDSIEEVNTQRWRTSQMQKDSSQEAQIKAIDSLVRLNVYLTNKIEDSH